MTSVSKGAIALSVQSMSSHRHLTSEAVLPYTLCNAFVDAMHLSMLATASPVGKRRVFQKLALRSKAALQ